MMRLPLSASLENAGPASNSRSWRAVWTWIARPWPTSSTVIAAVPDDGRGASIVSNGRKASSPSQRFGNPRGNSAQAPPASASSTAHPGGAACCHTARGSAAIQSTASIMPVVMAWARNNKGSSRGRQPASASGVMRKLTSGIASALASGETSENCWNKASSAGSIPSVMAHWVRIQSRSQCPEASRPPRTKNSKPTAPKESQKPAASTAQGSSNSTSSKARASTRDADNSRAARWASATTPSM